MRAYDPVTVAIPLAHRLEGIMLEKKSIPSGDDVRAILKEIGLEELYSGKGLALLRNGDVVVLLFPRKNLVVDVIPATGEVGDALEVIAYHDRKLNALILEVLPANDIEYGGNIGIEPVIISLESGELESAPVFGEFEEDEDGVYLVINRETFQRWKEAGKLDTCPVCGGELRWKGEKAVCLDCGYGVKVV